MAKMAMPMRDFNGDGTSDLLFETTDDHQRTLGFGVRADWLIQDGIYAGGGNIGQPSGDLHFKSLCGDFNGDGTTDLLLGTATPMITTDTLTDWFLQNGTYAGSTSIGTIPSGWSLKSAGDFNGDGTTDLLFQDSATGTLADWFIQNGAYVGGTNIGTIPSGWTLIGTTGDFNGDGTTDLLFQNSTTGMLADWFIKNGIYVGATNIGTIPSGWTLRGASGDFNGDGTTDLLFEKFSGNAYDPTGLLADWFIHDGAYSGATNIGTPPSGWHFFSTGDYNGDGTTDLLFNYGDMGQMGPAHGTLADWFIHNGTYTGGTNIGATPSGWGLVGHGGHGG